jgi:hypothetical protein
VLWEKFERMFEKKTRMNKSCLRNITRLTYKDGTDMSEYSSTFQGLMNQATSLKLNLDDEVQAVLFLNSLTYSWENNGGIC